MLDRHALKTLAEAVGRGDGVAFRNLYNDRASVLFGFAMRLVGHREHATEVLQHTFVEARRVLNDGSAVWEAPDIELFLICRRHAVDVVRRHGAGGATDAAMADPVNAGAASMELLQLLQRLGKLSLESRDTLTATYFDCPDTDALAIRFGMTSDQTNQALRKVYAEWRAADPPDAPVASREADMLAMRQALGLVARTPASDVIAIEAWERAFAPFGELIEPVAVPEDAFDAITERVNAAASLEQVEKSGRTAEIWRALLYVAVAAAAAILIYVALVAIGDDAAARMMPF